MESNIEERLPVAVLRMRMRQRGMPITRLATEAGLWPNDLAQILKGSKPVSDKTLERLGEAIVRLGLDRDVEPDELQAPNVSIPIRRTA